MFEKAVRREPLARRTRDLCKLNEANEGVEVRGSCEGRCGRNRRTCCKDELMDEVSLGGQEKEGWVELRAVPIAAAVVRDGGTMSAAGALIDMAAEGRGTTTRDGPQDLELRLVLADMPRSQAIGRTVEVLGEPLDETDVTLCGSLRVMTPLEFLQHHFA